MVAITATNSATPSLQSALGNSKLAQARREANQAEATAQNLRAQADAAEVDAQKSKDRVSNLTARNQQADPTYTRPAQGGQTGKTVVALVALANSSMLKTSPPAALVQNMQGQTTVRIVSVRA